jgi:hypothetical protein
LKPVSVLQGLPDAAFRTQWHIQTVKTNNHPPSFHDPLTLVFAPTLVGVAVLFLVIGDPGQRVLGLLFLATGMAWLAGAWRHWPQ